MLAGIKHLNRLEQILARNEWQDDNIFEGLMLSSHGRVVEGTMSNLFFIKSGKLYTPDLSNAGVAGIIRDVILEVAHSLKIPTNIAHINVAELNAADEIFITNSLLGAWPVCQLEQQKFSVGPITQKIIAAVDNVRLNDKSNEII